MWTDLLRGLVRLGASLGAHVPALDRRYGLKARMQGPWECEGRVWLHGASLGECRVLLQVAARLPLHDILLTTQKTEVLAFLRHFAPAHVSVALAPADHPHALRCMFAQGKPRALVLCENELWPTWLRACRSAGVPAAIASGRMTAQGAQRWEAWGKRELTRAMEGVYALWLQGQDDADRMARFSSRPARLGGDWKWLAVEAEAPGLRPGTAQEWEGRPVDLALLSVHREEWPRLEEGLVKLLEFGACVALVPRKPEDAAFFAYKLTKVDCRTVKWPTLQRGAVSIVDAFGVVLQLLGKSRLALMGGSFAAMGTHDFREPLVAGVPVMVGPRGGHCEAELDGLVRAGVLRRLGDLSELCIGRDGRDCWLEGWFPWDARARIAPLIAERRALVEGSFNEFQLWLESL